MDKNSVAEVLRALAEGSKNRSETAKLRDIIDEVETALNAGVSRAAVLDALHNQGFTMTLKSFESALYRIRKKREQKSNTTNHKYELKPSSHDFSDEIDKKQRREKLADQFIKTETTNPILKRLNKEQK